MVEELQTRPKWPKVEPKVWREVYRELGYGEMGSIESTIYLEIKKKVKQARQTLSRQKNNPKAEQLAAGKEAREKCPDSEDESEAEANAIEVTRFKQLEDALALVQEELKDARQENVKLKEKLATAKATRQKAMTAL